MPHTWFSGLLLTNQLLDREMISVCIVWCFVLLVFSLHHFKRYGGWAGTARFQAAIGLPMALLVCYLMGPESAEDHLQNHR